MWTEEVYTSFCLRSNSVRTAARDCAWAARTSSVALAAFSTSSAWSSVPCHDCRGSFHCRAMQSGQESAGPYRKAHWQGGSTQAVQSP